MNKANGNAMVSGGLTAGATMLAVERHYDVAEIARLWHLSTDTVRRLFWDEPGVVVIEASKPRSRRYRTLRIPESVMTRVHRRLSK